MYVYLYVYLHWNKPREFENTNILKLFINL